MGKRRGRTGPGGAVVSSLSENSGGTIKPKKGKQPHSSGSRSSSQRGDDDELNQLAGISEKGGKGKNSRATSSSASSSSRWLGKSPQEMLREYCLKNNRKRPSFYPMNAAVGDDGVMRCVIHQGRKDGKNAKGHEFDVVIGVGDKPGADFAALNVLHQLEHGKPIERILAPEFRETWLDLDKRYDEMSQQQSKRAENRVRREQIVKRKENFEKAKESVHIPTESRQLIEDALLQQKVASSASSSNDHASASNPERSNGSSRSPVRAELIRLGFSPFDATYASQIFFDTTSALDYLCLNLDESELPTSFTPTADVEVVQHYLNTDEGGAGMIDASSSETLARFICLSKFAADRALKSSSRDFCVAFVSLYNSLTHNVLANHFASVGMKSSELAAMERFSETESIEAIYDSDATIGIGAVPFLPSKWAVVVTMREGCPGVAYSNSVSIAFVDMDCQYPCSAPIVLVSSSFENNRSEGGGMNSSQRRLLMRAAAGEVAKLRSSSQLSEGSEEPVLVVHSILSFLSDATEQQLLSSAATRTECSDSRSPENGMEKASDGADGQSVRSLHDSRNRHDMPHRAIEKPYPVSMQKDTPKLTEMMKKRSKLPAHTSRREILKAVRDNQVVVISGETGSGKTTQVPQFILEEATETREPISIVCTQPRRIAAMSVAERVAVERCQTLGESVGYQVKLNKKKSRSTRLLFCTTGVLLRKLQGDPTLQALTHVLVDEVHERSVETDFLLLLLREILPARPTLKVVLMSATLDAKKFSSYFASALSPKRPASTVPLICIPGRTFPVEQFYLAEAVEFSGYRVQPGDRFAKRPKRIQHAGKYGIEPKDDAVMPISRNSAAAAALQDQPQDCDFSDSEYDDGRSESLNQSVVEGVEPPPAARALVSSEECKRTVSMIDEEQVNVDLISSLVGWLDAECREKEDNGAILIFLPGAAEISAVIRKLSTGPRAKDFLALPLHSLLSSDEQNKVFARAPHHKRKVICATNIAETSITVEDVTVVIDTLRAKEMSYDTLNGCSVLEEKFISKAASKQRAGRAGRVSKGVCYRLVRQHTFEHRFRAQQKPEIQRVALEHLVLNILSIIPDEQLHGDVEGFLGKAVDPPESEAVKTAVSNLVSLGAVEQVKQSVGPLGNSIHLTALGKHLSHLPVDARIGKLLIYGVMFGCFDAALTMAATVSEKSPFFAPFDQRDEARQAKTKFAIGKSDLLTFLEAFNSWREIRDNREGNEHAFCRDNFLSKKTLFAIADGRAQLADAVADTGFCGERSNMSRRGWERESALNEHGANLRVLKAVICAALYPNIVRIDLPPKKYEKVAGGNVEKPYESKDIRIRDKLGKRLLLHPESINFFENAYATRWLAYFSKVETTKVFIRDSTSVSPYALLLFGGEIEVRHAREEMTIDKWIVFRAAPRVAVLARELRRELDQLLLQKFSDASIDLVVTGRAVTAAIIRLITTEA